MSLHLNELRRSLNVGCARDCHNHQSIVHHPEKYARIESETLSRENYKHCEIFMGLEIPFLEALFVNISRLLTFPDHEQSEIFVIQRVVRYHPRGPV